MGHVGVRLGHWAILSITFWIRDPGLFARVSSEKGYSPSSPRCFGWARGGAPWGGASFSLAPGGWLGWWTCCGRVGLAVGWAAGLSTTLGEALKHNKFSNLYIQPITQSLFTHGLKAGTPTRKGIHMVSQRMLGVEFLHFKTLISHLPYELETNVFLRLKE